MAGCPNCPAFHPETAGNRGSSRYRGWAGGIVARAQLLAAGVDRSAIVVPSRRQAASVHRGGVLGGGARTAHRGRAPRRRPARRGRWRAAQPRDAAWRWRIIPAPPSVIRLPCREGARRSKACSSRRPTAAPTTSPSTAASRAPPRPHPPRPRDPLRPPRAPPRARRAEFHHDLRPADIDRTPAPRAPGQRELRAALETTRRDTADEEPSSSAASASCSSATGSSSAAQRSPSARGRSTAVARPPVAVELDGRQHERPHQADSTTTATSGSGATATSPALRRAADRPAARRRGRRPPRRPLG